MTGPEGGVKGLRAPRVSVVIPAFNAESTLRRTLRSLEQQTFADFEILVVDDGSTDSTPNLLQTWQDPRLSWWRFRSNRGPSAARNEAVARAQGDLIAPLDADDWWAPEKLEAQIEALDRRPDAVLAYSWTDHVDTRLTSDVEEDGDGSRPSDGFAPVFEGEVRPILVLGNFLESGSNPLIRRQAWQQVGGFDEGLRYCEDWDVYLRLAALGPFVLAPARHVFYCNRLGSLSRDYQGMETVARRLILRETSHGMPKRNAYRRLGLANFYKYFFFHFCQSIPRRGERWLGLRYLFLALVYDPTTLLSTAWLRSLAAGLRHGLAPQHVLGRLRGHGALLHSIRWSLEGTG